MLTPKSPVLLPFVGGAKKHDGVSFRFYSIRDGHGTKWCLVEVLVVKK